MSKSFDGQRKGEKVLTIVRRHPIALRKGLYLWLLVTFAGCLPLLFFPDNFNMLWVFFGTFAFGGLIFFYHWIGWYFTIYIITNERVRLVTQKSIFGKTVIELPLEKVQNISMAIPGMMGELFKYGTIVLQTMVGDLVMDRMYKPEDIYNLIQNSTHVKRIEEGAVAEYEEDEESEDNG
jgi:uncharacterized membrane protein YdbT with pleckstrin-like domain